MKANKIRGQAYAAKVVRSLKKLGQSAIAEESAPVLKALNAIAGLPSPMKEDVFVRLVIDEMIADQFASNLKKVVNG